MSDSDESKRAWKSSVKMRQPNKFDTFKKPDESVMDCVRRISNGNILVEPKSLYINLVTQNNDDLKEGAVLQYKIARNLGLKHWIHEMRLNCQCDLPDCWIEKNLPSLTSHKLVKPIRSAKLSDAAVSSRDIRLTTDPSLPVVRWNGVDDSELEPSRTATEWNKGSTRKRLLKNIDDSARTKATTNEVTEYCMLSSCGSMDRRARRHALAKLLPTVFKDATGGRIC